MRRLLCNAELRAVPWTAVAVALLAACSLPGCATTDAKQAGDGFHSLNPSAAAESSWTDKLTAPFKKGANEIASANDNRAATANDSDALSLSKKPDKKNPDLRVALAQMHERAGQLDKAESEYKKALKLDAKHLNALMGYAHLQDRRSNLDEATKLYQKAIAAHPNEAGVYNDLGLCLHRHGKLTEANMALHKAVALAPDRKLYRNNLATLLVEQAQYDGALEQLVTAHGQAAAHYNLGYLLTKKGNNDLALQHFRQASVLDPSLTAARQWVARLSPTPVYQPQLSPALDTPQTPSVAQRYQPLQLPAKTTQQALASPPQPGAGPKYLQSNAAPVGSTSANQFMGAPAAVRYPAQQTSAATGTAALPPSPQTYR